MSDIPEISTFAMIFKYVWVPFAAIAAYMFKQVLSMSSRVTLLEDQALNSKDQMNHDAVIVLKEKVEDLELDARTHRKEITSAVNRIFTKIDDNHREIIAYIVKEK